MTLRMPPEVASEISSRLCATDDTLRQAFALQELPMSGADFEQLAQAIWALGYGSAIGDIADGPGPYPKLVGFADRMADLLAEAAPS